MTSTRATLTPYTAFQGIAAYIELFCSHTRIHSTLGFITPMKPKTTTTQHHQQPETHIATVREPHGSPPGPPTQSVSGFGPCQEGSAGAVDR
ncbi:hypothetical protein JOD54_005038 [Actinokineospora baliensis]|nr:hypothetical protein [Actinokineospora baliensis]